VIQASPECACTYCGNTGRNDEVQLLCPGYLHELILVKERDDCDPEKEDF
jgi:hypothetical protein